MLSTWYESGGARGLPLDNQELLDLALDMGIMPDEILEHDLTFIHQMLAARAARVMASRSRRR